MFSANSHLSHYITKELTPCGSFARKASISFTVNNIALTVRLSPLLSTSARTAPPPLGFPSRSNQPSRAPICDAEVRFQKVKLLIPGHIPGSFCEFRFSSSHVSPWPRGRVAHTSRLFDVCEPRQPGLSTYTWPTPPCMRHPIPSLDAAAGRRISFARAPSIRDRSAICETVDSRPHSGFVPNGWALAQPKPASGGAYIAPFAMCASLGNPASRRTETDPKSGPNLNGGWPVPTTMQSSDKQPLPGCFSSPVPGRCLHFLFAFAKQGTKSQRRLKS